VRPLARAALPFILTWLSARSLAAGDASLPLRVDRIVLHVLGGPSYSEGQRRFTYYEPARTQALWKATFGAHWIVWTDGTLWPRHVPPGAPPFWTPDVTRPADAAARERLAREAKPVYSHLYRGNSDSVGIEIAHSGRRDQPFPEAQALTVAWLVRTLLEMSGGRLDGHDVFGHKDLDRRPAYVHGRCERPGCLVFVDDEGRPYKRRVDPPETLFETLARWLAIPRPPNADAELDPGRGARHDRALTRCRGERSAGRARLPDRRGPPVLGPRARGCPPELARHVASCARCQERWLAASVPGPAARATGKSTPKRRWGMLAIVIGVLLFALLALVATMSYLTR
jgi:hypothetical protein